QWPQVAEPALYKLSELGYETLPHPPYLLDFSPTDYFFKRLDNILRKKCFTNHDNTKNSFNEFIASRTPKFYATGIKKLLSRWQKC
ncbi:hypothetical protein Angca_009046, partial [Angiostrongylus cantonensis]